VKPAGGGLLSSFVRSLGVSVVGTGALTRADIAPALEALKRKLMERNVAAQIADKCVHVRGSGGSIGSRVQVLGLGSAGLCSGVLRQRIQRASVLGEEGHWQSSSGVMTSHCEHVLTAADVAAQIADKCAFLMKSLYAIAESTLGG